MRRFRVLLFSLSLLLIVPPAFAQTADGADTPEDPKLREFIRLDQELVEVFKQKHYDQAIELCHRQLKLVPTSSEPHYNIACALARLGEKDKALDQLKQAIDLGFVDVGHIRQDDDLATLRDSATFGDLLKSARQKQLDAPHETGAEIPGVKTIEGFPEEGLRYRLRIDPAASKEKKSRLIIWLHPSGESMDNVVEALAPRFIRHGYALLVFTQKNYTFWTDDEQRALLEHTLPEVAGLEGVDANKPILMGFSAGGQMALNMWHQSPGLYGGLILDAAYPLDTELWSKGRLAPLSLPRTNLVKSCPIFVQIGGEDGGQKLWREVEKPWLGASVPLTIHLVAGRGHEWLFGARQIAQLSDWLKEVSAGKLPSDSSGLHPDPDNHDDGAPPSQVMQRTGSHGGRSAYDRA